MNKVLMGMAALPLLSGAAFAGQPLTAQQMDRVTAGFSALTIADAEGLAGESGIVYTSTAGLSQVIPYATAKTVNQGVTSEVGSTLYQSLAVSQSSTVTSTYTPSSIPGLSAPPTLIMVGSQ